MSDAAVGLALGGVDLSTLVLRGLVTLDDEDLAPGNMTLELGLTLWMSRTRTDLPTARRALWGLRRALLAVSNLDQDSEPVPLMAGDQRAALLALAIYLYGLARRAADSRLLTAPQIAEEALEALHASVSSMAPG